MAEECIDIESGTEADCTEEHATEAIAPTGRLESREDAVGRRIRRIMGVL